MRLQFIEHAGTVLWRSFSTRLNALGLLILSWVSFDPASVLGVWNAMPGDVRTALPPSTVKYVGMGLVGLAMLARVVKQPKMQAKIAEKDNDAA